MKRGWAVFLLLFSCGCASKQKVDLPMIECEAFADSCRPVKKDRLSAKIELKEDFLCYIFSPQCFGCQEFSPILNAYIRQSGAVIYALDVVEEQIDPENSLIPYRYTPTLALFSQGKMIERFDPDRTPSAFSSLQSLENSLKDRFLLSPMKEIKSEEDLGKIISEEDGVIYYRYERCFDCIYFETRYLNDFFRSHPDVTIYGFEMADYFEDEAAFERFAAAYGLSASGNPVFGYRGGVVPTFQRYRSGNLSDACVIFNDETEKKYDADGQIESVTVRSSYYEDAPFIDRTFSRSARQSAMEIYRENTINFYRQKFFDFVSL